MNGKKKKTRRNILNRKNNFKTAEEEIQDMYQTGADALKVYRKYLPSILNDLSKIKDPRNPKKVQHMQTMLMLYGILMFVFHLKSRRDANREVSRIFIKNMREFFPELDNIPHNDSLARLLEKIDAKYIEEAIVKLVKRLIADKKLEQYQGFRAICNSI